MQTMKYLRAATDSTSPQQLTLFYLLVFQTNKKKSPRECGGDNSTAEPVESKAGQEKRRGGGEFEASTDGNQRLPNTCSKGSPMG